MANRVSWFWGPFWAAKTAQLPSLDLSRLLKQEIPYAIEEIVVVGGAFVTTVAIAYVLDFALLVAFFSALIIWGVVFCQDVPNVYFSVRGNGFHCTDYIADHRAQREYIETLPCTQDQVQIPFLDNIAALLDAVEWFDTESAPDGV